MRRVAITGMGAVCAAGASLGDILKSFRAGRRSPQPPARIQPPWDVPAFACALDFPAAADRTCALAGHALREALAAAAWPTLPTECAVGVCMGTTVACQLNDFAFYSAYRATRDVPVEPALAFLKRNLADVVGRQVGRPGPRLTIANACSSSADALGAACDWVRSGRCDVAIAGGADELNRVPLCGFHALGVVSPDPVAPFDRNRRGLNLGEGAAVLVLESEEHALRRGLRPSLFLTGYGAACDAHHITAPHPEGRGLERAIRQALREAGRSVAEIDFVNAHGTGTRENDRVEGRLLAKLFGADVRFLSTKGHTGHTLGAAGALEAAFTAGALREGWIPASAGFVEVDPDIGAAPLTACTSVHGRAALSTSLAFGGMNAALLVECEGAT